MKNKAEFKAYLGQLGLRAGIHVIMHSSFRSIKKEFPDLDIEEFLSILMEKITEDGSLIIPAFSYCFKKHKGPVELFDRQKTASKVGAVSEVFRNLDGVVRNSAPTHSFCYWGRIAKEIPFSNSPKSPLGDNSVLDWLTKKENGHVLMLGTDFSAFTYGHYLEVRAPVPWADYSPWNHQFVDKAGLSVHGEQPLIEMPGCSKSFVVFEQHLLNRGLLEPVRTGSLKAYMIPVKMLYAEGLSFFRSFPEKLLCQPGTCEACDERWEYFLNQKKQEIMES